MSGKLQRDLDLVVDLFERMGLKANQMKTKFMVVRGTQAPTARSQETYNEMMKGDRKGPNWRKKKTACLKCGKILLNGSMRRHMKTIHHEEPGIYRCREVGKGETYFMEVHGGKGKTTQCPVPGCGGGATTKFSMYQHFAW